METVLVYALSENIGGVEEYVLNLSRYNHSGQFNYEYIILGDSSPYTEEMDSLNVKYHMISTKKHLIRNISLLSNLYRAKRKECRIVYFNTSALIYPVPYMLAKLYGYKIVLHSHLSDTQGVRKLIHQINRFWISRFCALKLACSTPAASWMFGEKSIEDCTIVPNAIRINRFLFDERIRDELRKELGIENSYVIGNVGRLTQAKNQSFLLNIMRAADEKGLDVKLLLVGDGEDEEKLKAQAESLGIMSKVIFYGRTSKPEDLMSCMDCIVMPSLVEGFPITLVEAQASGLPCLVADTITQEVNVTGKVEFLSLNDSPEEWLDHISKLGDRYSMQELLREKGYDVEELEHFVSSLLKGIVK